MAEKKSYHHPDLRQALLDAALSLLREEGVGGVTIRKVAALAGVSHAAPYRHFASKDEIIATLMLEGHRMLARSLRAAGEAAPGRAADRLMALGRAYLDFSRDNPVHLGIMFSKEGISAVMALGAKAEATRMPGSGGAGDAESFAPLEHAVGECQAEGSLDPSADRGALALSIWAQVHGLAVLRKEGLIAGMSMLRGRGEEETLEAILGIMGKAYGASRGAAGGEGRG